MSARSFASAGVSGQLPAGIPPGEAGTMARVSGLSSESEFVLIALSLSPEENMLLRSDRVIALFSSILFLALSRSGPATRHPHHRFCRPRPVPGLAHRGLHRRLSANSPATATPTPPSKPPAPGENRVVFFGDSITDIWKLEDYFPGKPYLNRGIGGQTTPQMLVRFRQDVIDLHPKVVVILAGTNDIAGNTGPMRLEDIEADYASLAELARANHIAVVFSSVLPVHNYTPKSQDFFAQRSPEKILALNRWLKDYCAANGLRVSRLLHCHGGRQRPAEARPGRRRTAPQRRRIQDHGPAGGGGDRQGAGEASLNLTLRFACVHL